MSPLKAVCDWDDRPVLSAVTLEFAHLGLSIQTHFMVPCACVCAFPLFLFVTRSTRECYTRHTYLCEYVSEWVSEWVIIWHPVVGDVSGINL